MTDLIFCFNLGLAAAVDLDSEHSENADPMTPAALQPGVAFFNPASRKKQISIFKNGALPGLFRVLSLAFTVFVCLIFISSGSEQVE